jgi:GTPase
MTRLPMIALVGRPNVGKSTLFNRLVGSRLALVANQPGVTRDRLIQTIDIDGHALMCVDTGGFDSEAKDLLLSEMRLQTTLAIEEADLVVVVFDAVDGLRPADREVVDVLRKANKTMLTVVNKIDHEVHRDRIADFYTLGVEPIALSAEHGRGVGVLKERLLELLEAPLTEERLELGAQAVSEIEPEGASQIEWKGGPIRVAVIGKPNVGKSSLINKLLGEQRLLATPIAGTTRDSVNTLVRHEDQDFVFVDTAGIRKKSTIADRLEKFSIMSALRSIDKADVVLMLFDATQAPTTQDAKVAAIAHEKGKGIVVAANKWDLVENPDWRDNYPAAIYHDLPFLKYAEIVRVSAKTGRGIQKLWSPLLNAQMERHRRIATGELNRFFREVVDRTPPVLHKGRRAKLYFASQPLIRPPTFIFTTKNPRHLPGSYARFLRNALRERFGFEGTPIWLKFRPRGRQKAKSKGTSLDR